MDLAAGTQVNRNVRLLRLRGRGGMGEVWVAKHLSLDKEVAVKFVSNDAATRGGNEVLQRFEREAKAAAKLKSPHAVQIHDYGVMKAGLPFIVMELLDGQELETYLERHSPVSLPAAATIVTQVAKALQEAHKIGIVHRDIKPANIYLVDNDEDELFVKVLDFGVAKHAEGGASKVLTKTSTVLGTPYYMSPEQLLSPKQVDLRTDLWALGVVTYEMIVGAEPFDGETMTGLSMAICNDPHPAARDLRPELPAELDAWFDRALCKGVRGRFASAKEMAQSLREACNAGLSSPDLLAANRSEPELDGRSGDNLDTLVETGQLQGQASVEGVAAPALTQATPPTVASEGESSSATGVSKGGPSAPQPAQAIVTPPPAAGDAGNSAAASSADLAHAGTLVSAQTAARTPEVPVGRRERGPTFAGASTTVSSKAAAPRRIGLKLAGTGIGLACVSFVGATMLLSDDDSLPESPAPAMTQPPAARPSAVPTSEPTATGAAAPATMVVVAAGTYRIGCGGQSTRRCYPDEGPIHEVKLGAFAIMRHEVTKEEYARCVADEACQVAGDDEGCTGAQEGAERQPINCVTWKAASKYCEHRGWRLPTESEWEAASRNEGRPDFPWGNEAPDCQRSMLAKGKSTGCGSGSPGAVGSRELDKSWVGAFDMFGNVREWTSSEYAPYPGGTVDSSRKGKINRGSSYLVEPKKAGALHTRGVDRADTSWPGLGFRCAVTL